MQTTEVTIQTIRKGKGKQRNARFRRDFIAAVKTVGEDAQGRKIAKNGIRWKV